MAAFVGAFISVKARVEPNHKEAQHNMASKLIPANPSDLMVIRDVTPNVFTFSVPFLRFGRIPIVAEGLDLGLGFWGEGYGGEDCQGAGCEFD